MWTTTLTLLIVFKCLLQGQEIFAYRVEPVSKPQPQSSDTPLKRNVRVWTDENFACILRHCKQHVPGSNPYLSCLSENCRRGMMTVQRDLEYLDYADYADDPSIMPESPESVYVPTLDENQAHESMTPLDNLGACYERHCRGFSFKSSVACLLEHCISVSNSNQQKVRQKQREENPSSRLTKLNSMLEMMFSDRPHGRSFEEMDEEAEREGRDNEGSLGQVLERNNNQFSSGTVNKRRVNDEISQCIQSYCGNSVERVMCIVKHCHRSRSVYKRKK